MTAQPIVTGHRGARGEAPENTVVGFQYALGLGLTIIELDVRMAADGELVVIHDSTVDRTTNGSGNVADLTVAELQALDARSVHTEWPTPAIIPTFDEALEATRALDILLVEIKTDTPERLNQIVPKTIEAIRRHGMESTCMIISFDTYALELAQRDAPEIRRSLIGNWNEEHFLESALRLGVVQIDCHHPDADRALVQRARETGGFKVGGWQTNTEDDLDSCLTLNPDYISSDNPTFIIGKLKERGIL